jgi:DnaJ family protein B protein 4
MSVNYYKILGIEKKCTDDDVKKAYRKLAMLWHPDKHVQDSENDKKKAEDKFKEINKAYEILGNPEKRKQYDQFGENAFSGSSGYQFNNPNDMFNDFFKSFGAGGFGNRGSVFSDSRTGQKIHLDLGNMFNRNQMGGNPMSGNFMGFGDDDEYEEAKKDATVFVDLSLSLEDLYNGIEKKMKISRKVHRGHKVSDETEFLTIDVKPGWKEGTKITFNNKGDVNRGTEPADMVFVIKQKPHNVFQRVDNDLMMTLDVMAKEVASGFKKTIKDIAGEEVVIELKKNQIPDSNYIYKVKGRGMPVRKAGKIIGRGEMLVKFNIRFK